MGSFYFYYREAELLIPWTSPLFSALFLFIGTVQINTFYCDRMLTVIVLLWPDGLISLSVFLLIPPSGHGE